MPWFLQATENDNLYKWSHEYSSSLQDYNTHLQSLIDTVSEAKNQLETEKSIIVENLSNVRGNNKALQELLASLKVSYLMLVNSIESYHLWCALSIDGFSS
jgi:kinesin family protein C1